MNWFHTECSRLFRAPGIIKKTIDQTRGAGYALLQYIYLLISSQEGGICQAVWAACGTHSFAQRRLLQWWGARHCCRSRSPRPSCISNDILLTLLLYCIDRLFQTTVWHMMVLILQACQMRICMPTCSNLAYLLDQLLVRVSQHQYQYIISLYYFVTFMFHFKRAPGQSISENWWLSWGMEMD